MEYSEGLREKAAKWSFLQNGLCQGHALLPSTTIYPKLRVFVHYKMAFGAGKSLLGDCRYTRFRIATRVLVDSVYYFRMSIVADSDGDADPEGKTQRMEEPS